MRGVWVFSNFHCYLQCYPGQSEAPFPLHALVMTLLGALEQPSKERHRLTGPERHRGMWPGTCTRACRRCGSESVDPVEDTGPCLEDRPALSIVLPYYNQCRMLCEQFASWGSNLPLESEAIVVDDGSIRQPALNCSALCVGRGQCTRNDWRSLTPPPCSSSCSPQRTVHI